MGPQEAQPFSTEGRTVPQTKLQKMQQESVFEEGGHGPCPCHCLQGQAQNSEEMGEQGVCGGRALLPKPTSVCGISHRQTRA